MTFKRWPEAFMRPGTRTRASWALEGNYGFWGIVKTKSHVEDRVSNHRMLESHQRNRSVVPPQLPQARKTLAEPVAHQDSATQPEGGHSTASSCSQRFKPTKSGLLQCLNDPLGRQEPRFTRPCLLELNVWSNDE